jgi:hypothetical protein
MQRVKGKLFGSQFYRGTLIGNMLSLYTSSLLYQNIVLAILSLGMAYNTTWRVWIISAVPWLKWLTFPVFFTSLFLMQGLAMFIHWKFVLPSQIASSNTWSWEHQNPQRKHFEILEHNLRKLMEREGVGYDESIKDSEDN